MTENTTFSDFDIWYAARFPTLTPNIPHAYDLAKEVWKLKETRIKELEADLATEREVLTTLGGKDVALGLLDAEIIALKQERDDTIELMQAFNAVAAGLQRAFDSLNQGDSND